MISICLGVLYILYFILKTMWENGSGRILLIFFGVCALIAICVINRESLADLADALWGYEPRRFRHPEMEAIEAEEEERYSRVKAWERRLKKNQPQSRNYYYQQKPRSIVRKLRKAERKANRKILRMQAESMVSMEDIKEAMHDGQMRRRSS